MTGLPQMFGVMRKRPAEPDVPIEVRLWQQTLEDARRMQASAASNSAAVRRMEVIGLISTTRLAAEQYAYVRWLMGIDDYWLTLDRRTIKHRPSFERLPHQRLPSETGVRTPGTT